MLLNLYLFNYMTNAFSVYLTQPNASLILKQYNVIQKVVTEADLLLVSFIFISFEVLNIF